MCTIKIRDFVQDSATIAKILFAIVFSMTPFTDFAQNNWGYFAVAGLILILIGLMEAIASNSKLKKLSPAELATMTQRNNTKIFDLRPEEQFRQGHIPNSVNIDPTTVASRLPKNKKNITIVFICDKQMTLNTAANTLFKMGHTEVYTLEGGIRHWLKASMPIAKKNQE